MKIIHGMSEVAGQGINTVKGLRANGYDAVMAVWQRNNKAGAPDIDLGVHKEKKHMMPLYAVKMAAFAIGALKKYDVMHAHYGHSLFPFGLDTYFFRIAGLKCFAEFHGTEIRFIYNTDIESEYPYFKNDELTDKIRKRLQRRHNRLLRHVSGVIVHDYELLPHLPALNVPVYIVPLRVEISDIPVKYPETDPGHKPVIVHSPSKRSNKGTDRILEQLKKVKGDYELILVENTPHDEAMEIYRKADIIIDQIAVGTYGVFSIEAMAMGKPVIAYVSPEMKEQFPDEMPVLSTDFDGLPDLVDKLIADPQLRHDIGVRSRAYAERYHDNIKVAEQLYKIYDGSAAETDLFKIL